MVGTQQGHKKYLENDLIPSLSLLIMWGSNPLLTVSMADISVLHSAEIVHLHHNSRKSSKNFKPNHASAAKHYITLPRCDCLGTLRGLYKDSLNRDNPLRFQAKVVITLS